MRVRPAPFEHLKWLVEKTGCALTTDFNAIEAIDGAGNIRGMVGYCNWTQNAVQLHIAVDTPIVWRTLLRHGLAYPFVQEGKGLLIGLIPESNARSIAFAKAVGLKEAGRIRDGHRDGVDLVILTLRREDCRHIEKPLRRAA